MYTFLPRILSKKFGFSYFVRAPIQRGLYAKSFEEIEKECKKRMELAKKSNQNDDEKIYKKILKIEKNVMKGNICMEKNSNYRYLDLFNSLNKWKECEELYLFNRKLIESGIRDQEFLALTSMGRGDNYAEPISISISEKKRYKEKLEKLEEKYKENNLKFKIDIGEKIGKIFL